MRYLILTPLVTVAVFGGAVLAHHGWGSYDTSRKLTIESTVKHLQWQNPHVHIQLDYQNANWEIVLAPISRMQRRGLDPELIKEGTVVSVEGYASTRVDHELRAERIVVATQTFELR